MRRYLYNPFEVVLLIIYRERYIIDDLNNIRKSGGFFHPFHLFATYSWYYVCSVILPKNISNFHPVKYAHRWRVALVNTCFHYLQEQVASSKYITITLTRCYCFTFPSFPAPFPTRSTCTALFSTVGPTTDSLYPFLDMTFPTVAFYLSSNLCFSQS